MIFKFCFVYMYHTTFNTVDAFCTEASEVSSVRIDPGTYQCPWYAASHPFTWKPSELSLCFRCLQEKLWCVVEAHIVHQFPAHFLCIPVLLSFFSFWWALGRGPSSCFCPQFLCMWFFFFFSLYFQAPPRTGTGKVKISGHKIFFIRIS